MHTKERIRIIYTIEINIKITHIVIVIKTDGEICSY